MGPRFLIDTNVVIDLLEQRLPVEAAQWMRAAVAQGLASQSIINRIELLSAPSPTAGTRGALLLWLNDVEEWPLDEDVALEAIRIRRTYRRKLPDAVIAATALVHNLTVITRNLSDFKAIAGLVVLDPHDPAALPAL